MSELLKLKFIPDWDYQKSCGCYLIDIEEVDKALLRSSFCVEDKLDKNKTYTINIGNYGLELTSLYAPSNTDSASQTMLIKVVGGRFGYIDGKDIEEVLNALEMLKPEIEKYINTMRDKELAKEKRKSLWLEKEPFEVVL